VEDGSEGATIENNSELSGEETILEESAFVVDDVKRKPTTPVITQEQSACVVEELHRKDTTHDITQENEIHRKEGKATERNLLDSNEERSPKAREFQSEKEVSKAKDENQYGTNGPNARQKTSFERTKDAANRSPSDTVETPPIVERTTETPSSAETPSSVETSSRAEKAANRSDDTKHETHGPGAWRKRTSARVLPVLCDDGQEIDVLDSGDLFGNESDEMAGRNEAILAKSRWDKVDISESGCGGVDSGTFRCDFSCENNNYAHKSALFATQTSSPCSENSSTGVERSCGKEGEVQHKTSFRDLLCCFGSKQNNNTHNANANAQKNDDFDVFLSSASGSPNASQKPKEPRSQAKEAKEEDIDFERRGCCYNCLFLCKTSEDLNDELLRRTYQYRGEIKKYEEKLHNLEEEQNSFFESAQKRYEDLVWGKEDFIYDIKEIDFQMKVLQRDPTYNPQGSSNADVAQESTPRLPPINASSSITSFSSRHRKKSDRTRIE